MTAMAAFGTFYLPYLADRDKIRGLHEDVNKTPEENEKVYREMRLGSLKESEKEKAPPGGSAGMWKNLRWGLGGDK